MAAERHDASVGGQALAALQLNGGESARFDLTLNADAHPLMRRMHKPDPKPGPEAQDKRSVVPIESEDFEQWLHGAVEQAAKLVRLAPVEVFEAGPA